GRGSALAVWPSLLRFCPQAAREDNSLLFLSLLQWRGDPVRWCGCRRRQHRLFPCVVFGFGNQRVRGIRFSGQRWFLQVCLEERLGLAESQPCLAAIQGL